MTELIVGLVAGLVGAGAMRALMAPIVRGEPSEPALVLAYISGGDARSYSALGTAGHLLYGAVAGAAFAYATVSLLDLGGGLWVAGLFYGMVLAAIAMLAWGPLIGMQERMAELEPAARGRRFALFLGAHALYGVVLGALVQLLAT